MKKKISFVISALMMLSCVSINNSIATAEEIVVQVANYTDFERAIAEPNVIGIEVVGDITATDNLGIINRGIEFYGNNVTIDGNGKDGLKFSVPSTLSSPIIGGAINFINFNSERGAVIYNQDSTIITYIEGIFKNNTATKFGGAIYNGGTINIVADTQDTTFTGNTANGISNALYNGGTTNLNAGDYKITFNDGIDGYRSSTEYAKININKDFGDDLPTNGLEYNGQIKISS